MKHYSALLKPLPMTKKVIVVPTIPSQLSDEERSQLVDEMWDIHNEIFEDGSVELTKEIFSTLFIAPGIFSKKLIKILDHDTKKLVGYVSCIISNDNLDGKEISIFRSGAALLKPYRGSQVPIAYYILKEIAFYKLWNPFKELYIYQTIINPVSYKKLSDYAFLWPNPFHSTPKEIESLMKMISDTAGMKAVEDNELLRDVGVHIQETPEENEYWRQATDPYIKRFLEMNPNYNKGHGLVVLVPVDRYNIISCAYGYMKKTITSTFFHQPRRLMGKQENTKEEAAQETQRRSFRFCRIV